MKLTEKQMQVWLDGEKTKAVQGESIETLLIRYGKEKRVWQCSAQGSCSICAHLCRKGCGFILYAEAARSPDRCRKKRYVF